MNIFKKLFSLPAPEKPTLAKRSPKWPEVRKKWLNNYNYCMSCKSINKLEVHHIKPFHLYPELELDETNFITLCENNGMNCHFAIGHLLDWKCYNDNVEVLAAHYWNNRENNKKCERLPE